MKYQAHIFFQKSDAIKTSNATFLTKVMLMKREMLREKNCSNEAFPMHEKLKCSRLYRLASSLHWVNAIWVHAETYLYTTTVQGFLFLRMFNLRQQFYSTMLHNKKIKLPKKIIPSSLNWLCKLISSYSLNTESF